MNVLVVIPTYNERENLPDLVRAVLARDGFNVMVVDDASPDGTGAIADALTDATAIPYATAAPPQTSANRTA